MANPEATNPVTPMNGQVRVLSASFTRPANTTQYTALDLIANSATAGSVVALSWTGTMSPGRYGLMIRRAIIHKSDDDLTAASFRLHLFKTNPVATAPAVGDNGTIVAALNGLEAGSYLGSIAVDMSTAYFDLTATGNQKAGVPAIGSEFNVEFSTGSYTIYGLLESVSTYTPASGEVFTVFLEIWQD